MQKGDLVFVMGDPSRPILGKQVVTRGLISEVAAIKHGTMGMVLDVDPTAGRYGHAKVLIQGQAFWVSCGFVKVSDEAG